LFKTKEFQEYPGCVQRNGQPTFNGFLFERTNNAVFNFEFIKTVKI
jgi:hypothetical protein